MKRYMGKKNFPGLQHLLWVNTKGMLTSTFRDYLCRGRGSIPLTLTARFFSLNTKQVWSHRLLPRDPGKWKVRSVLTEAKHHTKDKVLCGYLQVFEKDWRKSGSLTWKGRWMQMDHLQITADSSICSIKTVLRSGKTSPKIWLQLSPGKLRCFKTTSTQDQPVTTAAIMPVAIADSFFFL